MQPPKSLRPSAPKPKRRSSAHLPQVLRTPPLQLLKDTLGATEVPPDYCRKCGRDYQPDGTCRRCDRDAS